MGFSARPLTGVMGGAKVQAKIVAQVLLKNRLRFVTDRDAQTANRSKVAKQSSQMVVDEIWNTYDVDKSVALEKEDLR